MYRVGCKECCIVGESEFEFKEVVVRASIGVWGREWVGEFSTGCLLFVEVSLFVLLFHIVGDCFIDFSFTFTLLVVIRGLPVPVIACLHGMCFGGGKFEEKFCTASLF